MKIEVYGKGTYEFKERLKKFGLVWSAESRLWHGDVLEETKQKLVCFCRNTRLSCNIPSTGKQYKTIVRADLRGTMMGEGRKKGKFNTERVYVEERR